MQITLLRDWKRFPAGHTLEVTPGAAEVFLRRKLAVVSDELTDKRIAKASKPPKAVKPAKPKK